MVEPEARERWRPTRTTLVAGGLVLAGLFLTEVNWWFLLLAGLGALGPGFLREVGWLHDKDEFQRPQPGSPVRKNHGPAKLDGR